MIPVSEDGGVDSDSAGPFQDPATRRLLLLDGLRGFAALWVAMLHFYLMKAAVFSEMLPAPLLLFLRSGGLGVDIFFVLSGFVIAHTVRQRWITSSLIGRFVLRRSLRLDPPYWIVMALFLAGYCLAVGVRPVYQYWGWQALLANMFYVHDLLGIHPRGASEPFPVLGVAWTLCLEVQFYLAFVCLAALSQRIARWRPYCAGLLFGPLALFSVFRWYFRNDWHFFGLWHMFFMGVCLHWALNKSRWKPWFWICVCLLGLLAVYKRNPEGATAVATLCLIYIAAMRKRLHCGLNFRWLQYLGRISYSLYLVHLPFGTFVVSYLSARFHSHRAVSLVIASGFFATLLAAHLINVLIELPAIRLSRRIKLTPDSSRQYASAIAGALS